MSEEPIDPTQSDKPSLGSGNVTIMLAGKERVLKPSLRAFQALSRQYGGLRPVINKLEQIDFDAMTLVIAVGLGMETFKAKSLAQQIWASGVVDGTPNALAPKCMQFVLNLMNGGTAPGDNEDENSAGPI